MDVRLPMHPILSNLTDPQREAAQHLDGPLLVLAGPGSGKTRVITHRIAFLLSQGIPPNHIAALTFTNKAADEMRRRVEKLAPNQPVWMGTYHRFCAQLLRRYASTVGLSENYSILDTGDSKLILRQALEQLGISTSHTSPEQIANVISKFKNRLLTPEMLEGQSLAAAQHLAQRVYPRYQQSLLQANSVDFDDLLLHVARMLQDTPDLRQELDAKYRYILVDEYQDTNLAQYAIVRSLSIDYPNLMVTGDPDQSIYGWRGAHIKNILGFEKDYPRVHVVRLEENYRSTPEILHVADRLIRNNKKRKQKELFTNNPSGSPVVLRMYNDSNEEADDIALQIASGIDAGTIRPRDVAIFCRMNSLTRSLEHALNARGVPYQIINGVEFYQRKEIKDVLSYLHLLNNPANDAAFLRIINTPTRGIGDKTIKTLQNYAARHRLPLLEAARQVDQVPQLASRSAKKVKEFVKMYEQFLLRINDPLAELIMFVLAETNYYSYLAAKTVGESDNSPADNVDELISSAKEFDNSFPEPGALEAFLEQVALISDTDAWEDENDRVTLMTLHAAKGLEFPVVYIVAVEERILPHERSMESPSEMEEERRLLFVGITRAERELQLSFARRRIFRGVFHPVSASQFLMELPRGEMRIFESADPFSYADQSYDEADQTNDNSYPDSWNSADDYQNGDDDYDDVCQLPPEERSSGQTKQVRERLQISGVTTGAELLAKGATGAQMANKFHQGMRVEHSKYGEGEVIRLSGIGTKRTATVQFDSGNRETFRITIAQLTPVD